jgi:DHA1 family bicyclomycin/chloramphenicol resistance-like MFS transporter
MLRPDTFALTGLLALLVAFGPVATDLYVPSMPEIGRLLGASPAEVQLTLSSYLVGFAFGQIIYGAISDRYGRKPVLLFALVLFCVASAACAAAPGIESLIAARILQARLARAIVRDCYAGDRAGRELSKMGAIMSIAPMLAPLIGSVVQISFGWRANFIIVMSVGCFALLAVWQSLPETLHQRSSRIVSIVEILRDYHMLLKDRTLLAHIAIVSTSYAGLFAWISGSPFVLQELHGLSALEFGFAFGLACIGSVFGAALAAPLVMRIGLALTIGLGTIALAGGGLAMVASVALATHSVAALVLSMMLYQAGLGLAMPQAIAGALTPFPDHAGAASSLVGFMQQTSAALLGAVVGHMLGFTAWPLAAAVGAMGCASLLLWMLCIRAGREGVREGILAAAFDPNQGKLQSPRNP